jgi:serine/threonine-protein kinase
VIAQHPGLVKVFDYGQIPDGPLYLQMEYLEGETLAKRLLKTGKLPIETTIRWIRQIASAMALAHARDIVHRDAYVISRVCFQVDH